MYCGETSALLSKSPIVRKRGKIQLIFTSPPFVLNRKKKYGNLQGDEYVEWLSNLAPMLGDYLTANGSIVIELGNAWLPEKPVMSTLPMKALLAFQEKGGFHLCQEFICFNPARLPSPAQWVTVERIRVKDAFTRLWWMSKTDRPKADNRKILTDYSDAMRKLLARGTYNAGKRPSEHLIGQTSFLKNNGGAIPPSVLIPSGSSIPFDLLPIANTKAHDPYQTYCRANGIEAHPARMPDALAEFFITFLTEPDDWVMDPFAGSNTTGVVAERLRRRWLGIEANVEYVQGSAGRFEVQPQKSAQLNLLSSG